MFPTGMFYKVEGFPQLSTLNSDNPVLIIGSEEILSTHANSGGLNYVAVPVGVNVTPSPIPLSPKQPVQCCSQCCLSRITKSQKLEMKRKYNSINSKDDQLNYLTSKRCLNTSSDNSHAQGSGKGKNMTDSMLFLIPTVGENSLVTVCKNAFRFIYGLSLTTMNNLMKADSALSISVPETSSATKTEKLSASKQPAVCESCGRTFSTVYVMRHHLKSLCSKQRLSAKKCQFQGCEQKFHHTTRLAAHMREVHSANIEPERHLKFTSEAEFLTWKQSEEARTYSLFTQNSGTRKLINSKVTQYACQRDGRDRAHVKKGQPERKTERRRSKGRVKSNITCVAYMKAEVLSCGTVKVLYSPTHSHPLKIEDTVNHPITPKVKEAVEKKIGEGYAPKEIVRRLKSQSTNSDKVYVELGGRLVNQRVVSALARGKYPSAHHLHSNDNKAVTMLIEHLRKQQPSALIAFIPHAKLNKPLFLVLQHPMQRTTLKTRLASGKKCVLYISSLENTSNWDAIVYSALISDDLVGAVPVAFCITDRRDVAGLVDFVKSLQAQIPNMWQHVSTLFVAPQLANHVRDVLAILKISAVLLLSARHTLTSMQTLLTKVVTEREMHQQISQCLPRIVSAKNKTQFLEELQTLRALVSTSPVSVNFLKQFELNYLARPGEWALCVRDPDLHACDLGESFNNILLDYHQSKYPLKRLDDAINTLLKIGEDLYSESNQQNWLREISARQEEFQCHMEEESGEYQVLDTSLPGQWEVKNLYYNDISVYVTAIGNIATSPVPEPLDYHCTCSDLLPLCCHILRVHAMQLRNVSDILVPEPSNNTEVSTQNNDVIFIDVFVDNNKTSRVTSDNVACVEHDVEVPEVQDSDVCFEVVIETSDSN